MIEALRPLIKLLSRARWKVMLEQSFVLAQSDVWALCKALLRPAREVNGDVNLITKSCTKWTPDQH